MIFFCFHLKLALVFGEDQFSVVRSQFSVAGLRELEGMYIASGREASKQKFFTVALW